MHKDFADWYRIASIDLKDIDLSNRWGAIEAYAKAVDVGDVLDAARLFFGLPVKGSDFLSAFKGGFKEADDKFSMKHDNVEVRVLAGALLVSLFESDAQVGDVGALALRCGSFSGNRTAPVGDIVRLAQEAIARRSVNLRRHASSHGLATQFEEEAEDLTKKLEAVLNANGALNTSSAPMINVMKNVNGAVSSLVSWAQERELERAMRQEESNILWWIFSEFSRDHESPFSSLKAPSAPLVVGKELGDLVQAMPGPHSSRAFLQRALRSAGQADKKTTLADAVAACSQEWRTSVSGLPEVATVEDLCPVLWALKKGAETEGKKAWHGLFEKGSGLKASQELTPLALCEQVYCERLLSRSVAILSQ